MVSAPPGGAVRQRGFSAACSVRSASSSPSILADRSPKCAHPAEGCGDALINGGGCHVALWRVIGLDRLKGEDVVSLGKLESNAEDGGRGATLDSEDDTIIAVAAEIELGIAPGVKFRGSTQGLTGADGTSSLSGMVDDRKGDSVAPLRFAQEGDHRDDFMHVGI
jgi:hypothetical protein